MTKRYNVGDEVWYASFSTREVKVPCPVCFGKKEVIVILGNDDEVAVACAYCEKGFEGSKGFVIEWVQEPRAELRTITRCSVEDYGSREEVEYYSLHSSLDPENIFDSESEAFEKASKLKELHETGTVKYKNEKSYTWNAGYHMKNAASKRKEAEYHEAKAKICKDKSKEK